jgi:DNA-binding MarR family transcriptional regulator
MVEPRLLEDVIGEVRSLFHLLRAAAGELHGLGQSSAGLRGVLESLGNQGPLTVPHLARSRAVSRQHIQVLVNELTRRGLVHLTENPAHKRSKLIALTDEGSLTRRRMRRLEKRLLTRLPVSTSGREMQTTLAVLQEIRRALEDPAWRDSIRRPPRGAGTPKGGKGS